MNRCAFILYVAVLLPVLRPGAASGQEYGYDIALKSGDDPVCAAYVHALSNGSFPRIARCERADAGGFDGFRPVGRKPLQPKEVSQLLQSVEPLLATGRYRPGTAEQQRAAEADFERTQQRAIDSGQPHRFFYRFDPQPDIDNDGAPEDVVVWKDTYVPCGVVRIHEPDFSPTYLLILDPQGKLDENRTRAVFGLESIAPAAAGSRKWLGDSFGVFRFRDEFYIDTFVSYLNLDHKLPEEQETALLETLQVFKRKGNTTRLVCEIRFSPIG